MVACRWLCLFLVCLACASCTDVIKWLCYGPDIEEVKSKVNGIVRIGEQVTYSASKLGAAGMTCNGMQPARCAPKEDNCSAEAEIFTDKDFRVVRIEYHATNCLCTP